jgi:hypothetical protein
MTFALAFVVSYEVLGLSAFFAGFCWGHTMFKCFQYEKNDSKVCDSLLSKP